MRAAFRKGHAIELAALGAFAGGAALCAIEWDWLKSVLAGFSLASTFYVVTIAIVLQRASESDLPGLAARHDQRAAFVLFVGLVLDFAAMGLVVLFLTTLKMDGVAVALAALSILSAWILLNTLFAIHYAHIYFSASSRGIATLSFPGEAPRVFSDFLYFSFVIGMTFQVSDVAIADARLRRLVLAHSILAFLFNVFVIALAVNAVGSVL